jgi:hypothetical protein
VAEEDAWDTTGGFRVRRIYVYDESSDSDISSRLVRASITPRL